MINDITFPDNISLNIFNNSPNGVNINDKCGAVYPEHLSNIISNINKNINTFVQRVNSSAVTVNASTRFNDGGEIGLGSEIAISTTKVSPRGPLGLEEITTYKWLIKGKGHIRD